MKLTLSGQPPGTTIIVDGQDISRFTNDVQVHARANSIEVTARIGLIATEGLDISVDAVTTLELSCFPGYVIEEEPIGDGRRRLRVVREHTTYESSDQQTIHDESSDQLN
jgi:hypothetical protein